MTFRNPVRLEQGIASLLALGKHIINIEKILLKKHVRIYIMLVHHS